MALKVNRTFKGETSRTGEDQEEVWHYDVHADDLTFTVTAAKTANDGTTAIPARYSIHPTDNSMVCDGIDASRDENRPTLIRVTVTWRTPRGQTGAETPPEGATQIWGIELQFDREAYEELENRDLDGKPLANSAGDIVEPKPRKSTDAVYTYVYYVKNLDWVMMGAAHGCVNTEDITLAFNGRSQVFEKHTLMIEPRFGVVQQTTTTTPGTGSGPPTTVVDMIYKVECRLTHRVTGWFLRFLDQGFYYYDGSTKKQVMVGSQPSSEPVLLDGTGEKLADGATAILYPEPSHPHLGDGYRMVYTLDFTTLPGFGG